MWQKTRRLPFLVTNYFRQKQSDSCIIVCTYSFYLDDIYYNYDCKDDINVRIDFYYGDNEVIGVPFTVSTNVLTENPNIELDEQYIEYECFDGVTVFSEESEFINDRKAPKIFTHSILTVKTANLLFIKLPKAETIRILLKKCDNSSSFKIIFLCFKNCFKCCFASLFHC